MTGAFLLGVIAVYIGYRVDVARHERKVHRHA